jgi:hypothetical protein
LEAFVMEKDEETRDMVMQERLSRDEHVRRTQMHLLQEHTKQIRDLEGKLGVRLERESANREEFVRSICEEVRTRMGVMRRIDYSPNQTPKRVDSPPGKVDMSDQMNVSTLPSSSSILSSPRSPRYSVGPPRRFSTSPTISSTIGSLASTQGVGSSSPPATKTRTPAVPLTPAPGPGSSNQPSLSGVPPVQTKTVAGSITAAPGPGSSNQPSLSGVPSVQTKTVAGSITAPPCLESTNQSSPPVQTKTLGGSITAAAGFGSASQSSPRVQTKTVGGSITAAPGLLSPRLQTKSPTRQTFPLKAGTAASPGAKQMLNYSLRSASSMQVRQGGSFHGPTG